METLSVKVISPQDVLFQDTAQSVSSKNSSGDFDVLPKHADFVTIIENQPIVITPLQGQALQARNMPFFSTRPGLAGTKVTFRFPLAIIYTTNNTVTIFAKTESPTL